MKDKKAIHPLNELGGLLATKMINASDQANRGIDVVNKKIKPFAGTRSLFPSTEYKILLLDEADSLTIENMKALRRTIEKYNSNCRFILTANEVNKISPAIRSRCVEYEFQPVNNESMILHLKYIAMMENISFTNQQFQSIAEKVSGDVRAGVNLLQNMQVDASDYNAVFGQ